MGYLDLGGLEKEAMLFDTKQKSFPQHWRAKAKYGQERQKHVCVADSLNCSKELLFKGTVWSCYISERGIQQSLKSMDCSFHSQNIIWMAGRHLQNKICLEKLQKCLLFHENDAEGRSIIQRSYVREKWQNWPKSHIKKLLCGWNQGEILSVMSHLVEFYPELDGGQGTTFII